MHITVSWEGVEEVVEVDEGCRSVSALLETVAAALPELDAEKVCLEVGGCAADDEAVCGLCEGCVVTVSATAAVREVAALREDGYDVEKGFCRAARKGDLPLCRLYLEAGVAFESGSPCFTPLHYACDSADIEICKLLIDGGHPLDVQDGVDRTPLHYAVDAENKTLSVGVCRLLIDSGCALNVQEHSGDTPLHLAVRFGLAEQSKLLIGAGCATNVRNNNGETPVDLASRTRNTAILKLQPTMVRDAPAK